MRRLLTAIGAVRPPIDRDEHVNSTEASAPSQSSASQSASMSSASMSARALVLHRQVALRPEPFGALAYHYETRRLVFLKHPDVVRVVEALGDHPTVADTLEACGIDRRRWPSFERALTSLLESEVLHDRTR